MPQTWQPNPTDHLHGPLLLDILQVGQSDRQVWDGNNPRWNPAFGHGEYYGPPPDDVNPYDFGYLMDQHNKVARIEGNRAVLDQLAEEIFE